MDEGVTVAAKAMTEKEMVWGTSDKGERERKGGKTRSLRYRFFQWLIPIVLPGHHIAENPAKRKERS